jgi:hypothetical protein
LEELSMSRADLPLIAAALVSACSLSTPQSDGSTQTVGVDSDGRVGVQIEGEKGRNGMWANFWSKDWPESAPVFAPAYPGAEISVVSNERRDGFDATQVTFETQDSVDAVLRFYQSAARKGRVGPFTRTGDSRAGTAIAMTDKKMLLVDAKSTDKSTKVSVIFGDIGLEDAP